MLQTLKQCAPWLNWKIVGVVGLVAAGLILCTGLPSLSIVAGVAPLLLLIACLVPCLAPLVVLRRKAQSQSAAPQTIPLSSSQTSCGCGQENCQGANSANSCKN